jgi:hypothetical protein
MAAMRIECTDFELRCPVMGKQGTNALKQLESAFGALLSAVPVPASVSLTNPLRSLSLDGVNR